MDITHHLTLTKMVRAGHTNVPAAWWVLLCCSSCPPFGPSAHPAFQTGVQICPSELKSKKKRKSFRHLSNPERFVIEFSYTLMRTTFSKFIECRMESMPLTTPDIDFVTCRDKTSWQTEGKIYICALAAYSDPLFNLPYASWPQFGLLQPLHLLERSSLRSLQTGSFVWWHSPHGSLLFPYSPSG